MAKSQIGAIIGVEGAAEYRRQINDCVIATKNLASATKLVEASFQGQTKTVADLTRQKLALQGEISGVGQKLALQRAELEKVTEAYNRGDENALKYKNEMIKLATETNKTETELYNLEQRLRDLPADNFIGKLELIKENLQNNQTEMKKWGDLLTDIGGAMTKGVTLPVVAGFTASVKSAVDWESALNGVRKTTDMSSEEIDVLAAALKDMALETTYSSGELANIAQIAGQLGVRGVDDISKFVQVVSDLGISTDLSANDAATALARIFNITEGGNMENLERIGSVIVHLGNNMATTEPEIVAMANRMASAASVAGLTTEEIFALSAALSSVGITAEAGGSTIGQVLTKIGLEFDHWSTNTENHLDKIATISGMSAQQFAETWQNEPVKAFEAFVTGLGNLGEESESVNQILDELGMAGIRESNMLKAMAQAQEEGVDTTQLLTRALELTKEAYDGVNESGEKFNALQQEADVRKSESATQFSNLKEAVSQLGQAFGEVLLPVVVPIVQGLTDMIKAFSRLDGPTKELVVTLLGLLAAVGPVLSAVGTGLTLFSQLSIVATTLNTTIGGLITGTLLPIVGVIAGVVAAIVAVIAVIKNWSKIVDFLKDTWNGFLGFLGIAKDVIVQGLTMLLSDMWNWITEKVDGILSWVLQHLERGFLDMLVKGINFASKIRDWLGNVKDIVVNGFRSIVDSASNWGRDMIDNFLNGIRSKWDSLVNTVSQTASTIWSYLHFSEPEKGPLKNFNTWMPDMMRQMAEGIEDNAYLVENAISNVAGGMGTAYNYGGVVINLNVPQGANGYQLVDEIENALAQRTERRRAVFG